MQVIDWPRPLPTPLSHSTVCSRAVAGGSHAGMQRHMYFYHGLQKGGEGCVWCLLIVSAVESVG